MINANALWMEDACMQRDAMYYPRSRRFEPAAGVSQLHAFNTESANAKVNFERTRDIFDAQIRQRQQKRIVKPKTVREA